MDDVQNKITSNSTEEEIAELIKLNLCSQLPYDFLKDACNNMVTAYLPEIVEMVFDSQDLKSLCIIVDLCEGDRKILIKLKLKKSPLFKSLSNLKSGIPCQICQTAIDELRTEDEDPNVQLKIMKYLEDNLCKFLGPYKQQCIDTINQYGPEIMQVLATELDSNAICSALGLCTDTLRHNSKNKHEKNNLISKFSHSQLTKLTLPLVKPSDVDLCADCEKLMDDVQNKITSNSTEEEIAELIKLNLCSQLPYDFLKDACNNMVTAYLPEIVEMVFDSQDLKSLCIIVDLCEGDRKILIKLKLKKSPLFKSLSNLKSGIPCQICQTAIDELRTEDEDPNVQLKIMKYLEDNLCKFLGPYKQQCIDTINQYGPEIMQVLATELDSNAICSALGLCTDTLRHNSKNKHEKINLISKFSHSQLTKKMPTSEYHLKVNGFECIICKELMKEVQSLIRNNDTIRFIIEEVQEELCERLPGPYFEQCKDFLDLYGEVLLDMLIQQVDVGQLCTKIGYCSSKMGQVKSLIPNELQTNYANVRGFGDCLMCMTQVTLIDWLLDQPDAQEKINEVVEKLCGLLPEDEAKVCAEDVPARADEIIDFISKDVSPRMICKMINLCS